MPAQMVQSSGGSMGGTHNNTNLLVPEKTSMVSLSAPIYIPMTMGGDPNAPKPLIGAQTAPQQLTPGANPFADINDLLG